MSKVTLSPATTIDSTLLTTINNNNTAITNAVNNTLSRDGTIPNQMNAPIDMNSQPILNIPNAFTSTMPVALGQLGNIGQISVSYPTMTGDVTGTVNNTTGQIPTTLQALSGDVSTTTGRVVTLNTVNANVGTFGSGTQIPTVTVNAKGLVTAASSQAISNNSVSNAMLAQMPANTVKGNNTGVAANASDLTQAQLTSLVNTFTSLLSGTVPASGGGTANFLRADGTWNPISVSTTPTIQKFTTGTGTYTPTAGTVFIKVRMCGGGGGGGAQVTNAGTNGSDTSFGTWTAIHGNGGSPAGGVNGAGGTGGVNGTGTLIVRIAGSSGSGGGFSTGVGGSGGMNAFGGSGAGVSGSTGGSAPANSGGGGAGGGGSGSVVFGSGGGAGEYVEFFMTAAQIGASQTYTVGTGGNGGLAGTVAGGNGAAAIIIIEEYPF